MVAMAKDSRKTPVSCRINAVLFTRLMAIGEPDGWNKSDMIERAIDFYVREHDQRHAQRQPDKPARRP